MFQWELIRKIKWVCYIWFLIFLCKKSQNFVIVNIEIKLVDILHFLSVKMQMILLLSAEWDLNWILAFLKTFLRRENLFSSFFSFFYLKSGGIWYPRCGSKEMAQSCVQLRSIFYCNKNHTDDLGSFEIFLNAQRSCSS